jgi:hypothetical protein
LNKKAALTILLAMLAISMSFVATAAYTSNTFADFVGVQQVDGLHKLAVSVPIVVGASLHGNSTPLLDQPTRLEISNFIKPIQVYISEAYATA